MFGAGLPEELLKAIPVAIGVWIAIKVTDRSSPAAQLRVAEPLDGILIGAAAGLGFAFVETLFNYVPRTITGIIYQTDPMTYIKLLHAKFASLQKGLGYEHAVIELHKFYPGYAESLQLLVPRLLANICGHAAYAGIFGYYIGLAASRPGQRVKIVLIGLLIAAGVHAAWNASGGGVAGLVAKLVVFGVFVAVIVKARETSSERSQLLHSQVFGRFSRVEQPPTRAQTDTMPQAKASAASVAPAKSITWGDSTPIPAVAALTIEIGHRACGGGGRRAAARAPGSRRHREPGRRHRRRGERESGRPVDDRPAQPVEPDLARDHRKGRAPRPGARSQRAPRARHAILIGDLNAEIK